MKTTKQAGQHVIARHPSAGNKRRRKHPATTPRSPKARPAASPAADFEGAGLLGAYQQQLSDLELTSTGLRQRVKDLGDKALELMESRAALVDLFENAPIGYIVHDRAGAIRDINKTAAALLGLKPAQGGTMSLAQFLPQDQLAVWLTHMHCAALHRRATTDFILHTWTGQPKPVQAVTSAVRRPLSRPPQIFRTALVDISQRRAAELALAQTQENYHRLIDTIEGIVWEADAATLDFTFVSRYAERLLGYPLEEWTRPDFWRNRIHVEDRERVANHLARAVARREKLVIEYRVVTAERQVVWLHDNVTVVEHGNQLKLLGVAVDVTERRNAEEAVRQANELLEQRVIERTAELRETVAELEAFSYSLSHDMRAPLRSMQGCASLLEDVFGERLGPEGLDYLRRIMNSAIRLDRLVQDVLKYSRVTRVPVELRLVELDILLNQIIQDYPALTSSRARIEIQRPLPPVYGHEAFITQALSNLLTNAVKFVPPNRKPRVRVWSEEMPRKNAEPGWVRIWVEDNGLGIAPEDQKRVFRIFERIHPVEKYEGTGIGLAIVQKAVQRMGGRVGVESAPGHGSKFWIELRQAPA